MSELLLCRRPGCALAIVWATTGTGKAMPVDAVPDPAGNLAIRRLLTGDLACRVVTVDAPLDPACEKPGMPHWSTCRNPPRREPKR